MSPNTTNSTLTIARLCKRAMGYALRRRVALAVVLVTMLAGVGLNVLTPWPMKFLIDYVLRGKPMPPLAHRIVAALPGASTPSALIGWTVASTVLLFLLNWAIGLAAAFGNISLGQRMTYHLAGDLFAKLQQLSLHFHARKSVGDNLRRVTADCACASVIVKDALLPLGSALVSLITMFCILWRVDATLALFSLAVVPYMLWVFRRYARPMMTLSYDQQNAEGKIYEVVERTFAAMPVVQAFSREAANDQSFACAAGDTLAVTLSLTGLQLRFRILMGLATALGTAGVLWLGALHVQAGRLQIGDIWIVLYYLASLYAPLQAIMYTGSTIQDSAGSARRVWEVLDTETQVKDRHGAVPLIAPRGHLRFENVTFGYEPGRPVLLNISLDAPPGHTIALVGATGAGKSTLVSLIPRFGDPWEGRVTVDGHDIRDLRLKTLRNHVALVLQEPFLFPMTIAENIAYGCPKASVEQIEAAARAANAHEFIVKLPKAYHTLVGERGATLSGGERQRVSIARALLKNAPILILDEPTSALDAETEHGLMAALERLTTGRTTFIIAHRLSTVRRATRILVLKDGAVAESGTHDELLQAGGQYAQLCQLQFGLHAH